VDDRKRLTLADRHERRMDLLGFLRTIQRPDRTLDGVDDDEGLVAAGLVDSLAVLQIVVHLEETYGIDFSARGVEPEELRSVGSILDLIEREARP
jgi:acyl carrier protein